MALPTELHDRIVGFLRDDIPALSACSLVSRAWRQSCQHHLLHSISIRGMEDLTRLMHALDTETLRPSSVLHLRITGFLGGDNLEILKETLERCIRLHRLELLHLSPEAAHMICQDLSHLTLLNTVHLLGSEATYFPRLTDLLGYMPSIEALVLKDYRVADDLSVLQSAPVKTVSSTLRSLALGGHNQDIDNVLLSHDTCMRLGAHFSSAFPKVDHIACLPERPEDLNILGSFSNALGSRLRRVDIDLISWDADFSKHRHRERRLLCSNMQLRHLGLYSVVLAEDEPDAFNTILSSITSHELETLNIGFCIAQTDEASSNGDIDDDASADSSDDSSDTLCGCFNSRDLIVFNWRRLNQKLIQFPKLRALTIHFDLRTDVSRSPSASDLAVYVKQRLFYAEQRGILKIKDWRH